MNAPRHRSDDGGPAVDPIDQEGPGSDPGVAYERAAADDEDPPTEAEDEAAGPGVGDVYRSGS